MAAASAGAWRAACRPSLAALPLRRPTVRSPKIHPTTGLPLSKAKGQHIIHNVGVVQKMVEAADVGMADTVYEVGCGTGELTVRLLPHVRLVHTIDIEPRMVQETEQRAAAAGLTNLHTAVGDALKVPMPRRFDVCVSNLPYQISSPFIFQLLRQLSEGAAWRSAVLMVQREFAERLLADPGEENFSRLAISVRLFARVVRLFDVRPGSFIPQPQVHSTVVRLEPRMPPPQVDLAEWDALVRMVFSRRRKTLRAQFKKISTVSRLEQNYKVWCSSAGQKPSLRPFPELLLSVLDEEGAARERAFQMDLDDLHSVLKAFHRHGIFFSSLQRPEGRDGRPLRAGRADDSGSDEDDEPELRMADGLGPLASVRPAGLAAGGPLRRVLQDRGHGLPGPEPPPPPPPADEAGQAAGGRRLGSARRTAPASLSYP